MSAPCSSGRCSTSARIRFHAALRGPELPALSPLRLLGFAVLSLTNTVMAYALTLPAMLAIYNDAVLTTTAVYDYSPRSAEQQALRGFRQLGGVLGGAVIEDAQLVQEVPALLDQIAHARAV